MNLYLQLLFLNEMKRNRMIICTFLCFILTYMFSCDSKEEQYADRVVSLLHEKGVEIKDFTHIVIIPGAGCGGCISEAEHFFQEYKDEGILFIFTKVYSIKELRLRLGSHLNRKNVLIDKEQLYISDKEEVNIYPIIIDVRDAGNFDWRFLEPGVSYQRILDTLGK